MRNPLKLLFLFGVNPATGYGHKFRSLALAKAAQERGHTVTIASDQKPPSQFQWFQVEYLNQAQLFGALEIAKPDWLIVDLPHTPPEWIRVMYGGKILTLNGIGYNQGDGADLRIIQGAAEVELPGEQDKVPVLKGLEYIILRPEIAKHKGVPRGEFSLVWGGGSDSTGTLQAMAGWFPNERAFFLVADMTPIPLLESTCHWLLKLDQDSDNFLWWLARCKRLITNFGMVVPEAIYLQTPVFSINASELHLAFASPLAEQGLIKNFPAVGLPSREEMERFLGEEFKPVVNDQIGIKGGLRVIKAIEERSYED